MAYVLLALLTCRNIHASTDFKGSKLVAKLNKCILYTLSTLNIR